DLDPQIERPDVYELLGIQPSETQEKVIASAADRAASRVRSHRPGPHAAEWANLLDEIAAAKKCLLDPTSRRQYDRLKSAAKKTEAPKVNHAKANPAHEAMQPWVPPQE